MTSSQDVDLTAQLQSEDASQALAILFDQYADRIYRLAIGLVGDSDLAEDIVQDTFLAVMKRRMQFGGRSGLGTWLYRIAHNACIDRLRRRTGLPIPEEDGYEDENATSILPVEFVEWRWTPEEMIADLETRAALDTAIGSLSLALRAVFILRDVNELSIEETAQALEITSSAVKVRLHRARLELRERLAAFVATQEGEN